MKKKCKNCSHFFQSGLAKSWGNSGYCLLIQNNKSNVIKNEFGFPEAKPSAIKSEEDSCDKFSENNHY